MKQVTQSSKTTEILRHLAFQTIYRSRISCPYVFVYYHRRRCGILKIYFTRVRWEFGRWLAIFPGQSACYLWFFPENITKFSGWRKIYGRQSEIVTESTARRLTVSKISFWPTSMFRVRLRKSSRVFWNKAKTLRWRFDRKCRCDL